MKTKVEKSRKSVILPPLPEGVVRARDVKWGKEKMTVGGLIHELEAFPKGTLVLISVDEEGNQFKPLCNLDGYTLEEEDDVNDLPFDGLDVKVGDPYVIIWPHG